MVFAAADPFWMVKAVQHRLGVSAESNVATDPFLPGVVTDAPPELVTVIACPWKLIFSTYVPGAN